MEKKFKLYIIYDPYYAELVSEDDYEGFCELTEYDQPMPDIMNFETERDMDHFIAGLTAREDERCPPSVMILRSNWKEHERYIQCLENI